MTTDAKPAIDIPLVRRLVSAQFPRWAELAVEPVLPGGWDHRSYRLGDDMVVRLPSAEAYAGQVRKEHGWLPVLAPRLPLAIPEPIALGEPGEGYPWPWGIRKWIEGEAVAHARVEDLSLFARDLGGFLAALHDIDSRDAPVAGPDNFFRGGALSTYDGEARQAIAALANSIDASRAISVWQAALASKWDRAPVWVHGDVSAGNLLVRDGRLVAVIDFGQLAAGDPACDLAIAWTFLTAQTRPAFRTALSLDDATWARGRGWALWKASIVAAGITGTNAIEQAQSWPTIGEILGDDRA